MSANEKKLAIRWIAWNALGWSVALSWSKFFWNAGDWPKWLALGFIVGTAQWLALRGRFRGTPAWIAATCLAWVAGIWAGFYHTILGMDDYTTGFVVGGTLAGLAQACVLWRQVERPALWGLANIGSYLAAFYGAVLADKALSRQWWFLPDLLIYAIPGAAFAITSAPALIVLLRHPKALQPSGFC